MNDQHKVQKHSRFIKAAILAAQRDKKPITITTADVQAVREFEERQGEEMQIAAIINGHEIELRVAEKL
jgi:hypothetical protein